MVDVGQAQNQPFDLPPVTEAKDIVLPARALGPGSRFPDGFVAKIVDQGGSIGQGFAAENEGTIHGVFLTANPVDIAVMKPVNGPFTMSSPAEAGLEFETVICHAAAMHTRRNTAAGGFFIFIATLVGIYAGVRHGQLLFGMLGGFAAGVAIAIAIWLVDRARD